MEITKSEKIHKFGKIIEHFRVGSFLLLPFNQCLGTLYLMLGAGLVVKVSSCQIILYILHFA